MYTGNENHQISLADAAALTANYRQQFETNDYIKAEFFGKQAVENLLNQNGCAGLRIYYGKDELNVSKLVIVGVNSSGNDMTQGSILEFGLPCPPYCSDNNPLNS